MTTIVSDGRTIACDLQITSGIEKYRTETKIFPMVADVALELFQESDAFIGFSGNVNQWFDVLYWMHRPQTRKPSLRNTHMLVLTKKGVLWEGETLNSFTKIKDPYFSIGSGRAWAIGAMSQGASVKEAIQVASKHDILTGLGVKEFKFA